MGSISNIKFKSVDEYLSSQAEDVVVILQKLRNAIHKAAPGAEELISYNMPAFKLHGLLVWYAAHKEHIGFYPKAAAIEIFRPKLSAYNVSKGAIQFPIDKPLPLKLITRIVHYRMQEEQEKAGKKAAKKPVNSPTNNFTPGSAVIKHAQKIVK